MWSRSLSFQGSSACATKFLMSQAELGGEALDPAPALRDVRAHRQSRRGTSSWKARVSEGKTLHFAKMRLAQMVKGLSRVAGSLAQRVIKIAYCRHREGRNRGMVVSIYSEISPDS